MQIARLWRACLKRKDIGMCQEKAGRIKIIRVLGGGGIERDQSHLIARFMGRQHLIVQIAHSAAFAIPRCVPTLFATQW